MIYLLSVSLLLLQWNADAASLDSFAVLSPTLFDVDVQYVDKETQVELRFLIRSPDFFCLCAALCGALCVAP